MLHVLSVDDDEGVPSSCTTTLSHDWERVTPAASGRGSRTIGRCLPDGLCVSVGAPTSRTGAHMQVVRTGGGPDRASGDVAQQGVTPGARLVGGRRHQGIQIDR